eukprot:1928623-Amphidinium_carterae.1
MPISITLEVGGGKSPDQFSEYCWCMQHDFFLFVLQSYHLTTSNLTTMNNAEKRYWTASIPENQIDCLTAMDDQRNHPPAV